MGYLDNAGLERLWSKIRSALSRKQDAASAFTQTQADERYLKLSGGRVTGELTLPGDYTEAIKFREGGEEGYAYIGTSNDADGSNYSIHIGKYYGGLYESIMVRGIETPEGPNDYIGNCAASKKYVDEAVASVRPTGGTSEIYSTEEQRIGTWIDGKPVYQITAALETEPDNPDVGPIAVLENDEIDALIDVSGYRLVVDGSDSYLSPIGANNPVSGSTSISLINGLIRIEEEYYANQIKYFVTLKYTKLSDTATT